MRDYTCTVLDDDFTTRDYLLTRIIPLKLLRLVYVAENFWNCLEDGKSIPFVTFIHIDCNREKMLKAAEVLVGFSKVIIISSDSRMAVKAYDIGAAYFMLYPYSMQQLLQAVKAVVMWRNPDPNEEDIDGTALAFEKIHRSRLLFIERSGDGTTYALVNTLFTVENVSFEECIDQYAYNVKGEILFVQINDNIMINPDMVAECNNGYVTLRYGQRFIIDDQYADYACICLCR